VIVYVCVFAIEVFPRKRSIALMTTGEEPNRVWLYTVCKVGVLDGAVLLIAEGLGEP
jgi:hypothetical protein